MQIIQAPMAGAQDKRLTIAVCQAGGIGSLPAALLSTEKLSEQIKQIQQAVGDALFNVNFFAHHPPQVSILQEQEWFNLLKPYLEQYHISIDDIPKSGGRNPFDEEALAVIQALKPPIVSFHFGLPNDDLLQAVKATGAKIWSSATTVKEARYLASKGVDAIIAQGLEAGGHRGVFLSPLAEQMGTFALLPNIIKAVKCPVIAAGGISDRQTVRVAEQLGASAVQVGTAFLLAEEANITVHHRDALQSEAAEHTVITNLFTGGYARGICTQFMQENGLVNDKVLPFPLAGNAIKILKEKAEKEGKFDFSSLWAGQNARLAKVGTAADIMKRLQGEK
ncbi:nitronate monooxygenase [Pelistega sp. NLN82]|uniref:Nitronate monooxygenase n=1 Tax=Pelistega ratti TaxID=2652177 RepID=A0A6L9Y4C1_9BURK|nr:nitronate monooxygenase [Pelistega ratti]NEN75183.1 nitronate monooxygenase [Pelistega ratti]